tara:strand:- start:154 stop:408 length:255 start_codon:yes stop_codon:yes gene_type:complete
MANWEEKSRRKFQFTQRYLEHFKSHRVDYTDRDIQMEILYTNWLIKDATEKTRKNTSTIVTIMAILIIISLLVSVQVLGAISLI